jgi:hypothetical protein
MNKVIVHSILEKEVTTQCKKCVATKNLLSSRMVCVALVLGRFL